MRILVTSWLLWSVRRKNTPRCHMLKWSRDWSRSRNEKTNGQDTRVWTLVTSDLGSGEPKWRTAMPQVAFTGYWCLWSTKIPLRPFCENPWNKAGAVQKYWLLWRKFVEKKMSRRITQTNNLMDGAVVTSAPGGNCWWFITAKILMIEDPLMLYLISPLLGRIN